MTHMGRNTSYRRHSEQRSSARLVAHKSDDPLLLGSCRDSRVGSGGRSQVPCSPPHCSPTLSESEWDPPLLPLSPLASAFPPSLPDSSTVPLLPLSDFCVLVIASRIRAHTSLYNMPAARGVCIRNFMARILAYWCHHTPIVGPRYHGSKIASSDGTSTLLTIPV